MRAPAERRGGAWRDRHAIYACLGQTLYLLGDFSKASAALEKAARACPDEVRIVQKYAQARLTETIIESSVEDAFEVYHAIAGATLKI